MQELRLTIKNWASIKLNSFCPAKDIIIQTKRQCTEREKIFTSYTSERIGIQNTKKPRQSITAALPNSQQIAQMSINSTFNCKDDLSDEKKNDEICREMAGTGNNDSKVIQTQKDAVFLFVYSSFELLGIYLIWSNHRSQKTNYSSSRDPVLSFGLYGHLQIMCTDHFTYTHN